METLLGICLGVGLSAACGFRIFVPPLVMSIAAQSGHLQLSDDFTWMGTPEATVAFGVGAFLEVGAYYIPWVDELLDIIATPTAVIAGTIITGSFVSDMSPMLQWTIAVIVGGGAAGTVQGLTDVTRLASTALTGGFANPGVSTMELLSSTVLSMLAISVPVLAAVVVFVVIGLLLSGVKALHRKLKKRNNTEIPPTEIE
ncbi:MAG: DUF4126 domain-containing protein [Okeania sp. SIO2F4]|uniref:DUF4126 domain-containing protein n=1 Tax=Microcoleaceae TaxID=1892252 RepID=UPI00142AAC24|nr:DUF4126 domain-containing protein [Okeania sp. SIO2F4]MDJ0514917.1 DUF4126 domain-containing protein [Trichodesmium sp. MO_231.B1]NES06396.1 DUF4126 domain-containing protein [Okeania sp. SIO2F4]